MEKSKEKKFKKLKKLKNSRQIIKKIWNKEEKKELIWIAESLKLFPLPLQLLLNKTIRIMVYLVKWEILF
jgi:hypothetical protein